MEKVIIYLGEEEKIGCDEKCNKAWGIQNRPSVICSNDEDDYAYLPDHELENARECDEAKPVNKQNIPNKWCVRECERCTSSTNINDALKLNDFARLFYNQPWKHTSKLVIHS